MKIGLIDVDGHNFPNLALCKISAYHKKRGDEVEFWNGLKKYNRVYKAKVFDDTYTQDIDFAIMADEIIKGGTGYDLKKELPEEIEHIRPDIKIYPGWENTAVGFLTRGCPRGCGFCIVAEKEGKASRKVADIAEFWNGQREIEIMDPNLLAAPEHIELLDQLKRTGARVNFNQGLDVRFLTEDAARIINETKTKIIHFAWDNYEFKTYEKLKTARAYFNNKRGRDIRVYVLTNYNTTTEQDLERIYKLIELDYDPFVMIYNKPEAPKETRDLQRWVNNKWIFRKVSTFEEYKAGRNKNAHNKIIW